MDQVMVRNISKNAILARQAAVAEHFWDRFKGLLGTQTLPAGTGLMIVPCASVHSVGMKYAIDVLFVDRDQRVVYCYPTMLPGRVSRYVRHSHYVLEVPAGTIAATDTCAGDVLEVIPCS